MRLYSHLTLVLTALFSASVASAAVIEVDTFSSPDMLVIDQAGGGPTVLTDIVRSASQELLTGTNNLVGNGAFLSIGSQSFPANALEVANSSGRDSEVKITWVLGAGTVPLTGAVDYLFEILRSDGNPTNVSFSFAGNGAATALQSFNIPGNTVNQPLAFAMSGTDQALLNGGGRLTMAINGVEGWDMTLDSFGFQTTASAIPEPTTAAMFAIGLLGLGAFVRRRKS